MDSKIKRLTFLGMLSAILMIAVIVVFVNRDKLIETHTVVENSQPTKGEKTVELEEDGMVKGAELSSFLKDDTFFDHDEKRSNAVQMKETNGEQVVSGDIKVSLLATSVEKDLRIKIVDDAGKVIAGQPTQKK